MYLLPFDEQIISQKEKKKKMNRNCCYFCERFYFMFLLHVNNKMEGSKHKQKKMKCI